MSDVKPFVLDFDLVSGFCTSGKVKPTQRRVSDMAAQFANEAAARARFSSICIVAAVPIMGSWNTRPM